MTASPLLGEACSTPALAFPPQRPLAGLFNDLATLFLSNPDDTIKHIFSLGNLTPHAEVCQGENCYFTLRSLAILSPAYLLLMAAGASLTIPGGLFMPSIMVQFPLGADVDTFRCLLLLVLGPGLMAMPL